MTKLILDTIDLVIFDCDGVLMDSEGLAHQALVEMLATCGIQMTLEESVRRYSGISMDDELADIRKRYNVELPADLGDRKNARQKIYFEQQLKAMPGVADLIQSLPYRKCVASGSSPERLRHTLQLTGLWDFFAPHIFSAKQVARGKPAPDVFLFAAQQMGVDPARCLVIEDSVPGVMAAVAANMPVIGFTGAEHCDDNHAEKLKQLGACAVFEHMDQIAQYLNIPAKKAAS